MDSPQINFPTNKISLEFKSYLKTNNGNPNGFVYSYNKKKYKIVDSETELNEILSELEEIKNTLEIN